MHNKTILCAFYERTSGMYVPIHVCVCMRTCTLISRLLCVILLVFHEFLEQNVHFILKINPDVCDSSFSCM